MAIDNPTVRWLIIGLVVLLLIPLVVMLGMMAIGAMSHGAMMSGMMGSGLSAGMITPAAMVLCAAWLALVAGALIFLIVLLAGNSKPSAKRDKAA